MTLRDGFGWRSSMTALVVLMGAGAAAPFAGCQMDDATAGDVGDADAGASRDAQKTNGDGRGSGDAASPSEAKGPDAGSGSGTAAVGDASEMTNEPDAHSGTETPDASPGVVCLPHGATCSEANDAASCCVDTCILGTCGCLPEGSKVTTDGGNPCCNNLAIVGGYCGTNACVPDGQPCGADAGSVCCNDNCNGTTCGG